MHSSWGTNGNVNRSFFHFPFSPFLNSSNLFQSKQLLLHLKEKIPMQNGTVLKRFFEKGFLYGEQRRFLF